MSRRQNRRGSAMLEFVLTGIPMIFVVISNFQMALGMWHYHTLQYAVKGAGAYVTHHGSSYVNSSYSTKTVADAANTLASLAIGIPNNQINVTWTAGTSSVTCRLDNCQTNTTVWPPITQNWLGTDITIKADYVYTSAISMVVATGSGKSVVKFGSYHLPGYTRQFILF